MSKTEDKPRRSGLYILASETAVPIADSVKVKLVAKPKEMQNIPWQDQLEKRSWCSIKIQERRSQDHI